MGRIPLNFDIFAFYDQHKWEAPAQNCSPMSREKTMRSKRLLLGVCAGLAVLLLPAATYYVRAQNPAPPALTGQVTSDAEGAMEGVIVSAKKAGSTVTVSVVSDAQGR
jgi:hypothetical protein